VKAKRWLMRFSGILLGLAMVTAVGACSSGSPQHPTAVGRAETGGPALKGDPPLGPIPVATGLNSLHLPLDPYYLSSSQTETVEAAEDKAERTCIQHYLPGVVLGTYGPPVTPTLTSDPLVYLDLAQAARYGYHNPPAAEESAAGSSAPSSEVSAVAFGTTNVVNGLRVPKGGCLVAGFNEVIKGIPNSLLPDGNSGPIAGIANEIDHENVQEDSGVIAVNRKWSACMAGLGYDYSSPGQAVDDPRWVAASRPSAPGHHVGITEAEVKTAVADVTCRSRVDLYGVYWAVAAAYQNEWLANSQNRALAQAQEQADEVMLTRAEAILGG